ncbi:hypothetical protein O181_117520, partial [Austropuccinia psidii MF-1]|nr:hypothetical protein [Austropuccinia psidii MF-1]
MEDIITRTRIGKTWTKIPMESKIVSKIPRGDRRPEKPVLKCHKCGSTSDLANTCTKKTKINEVKVVEEVHCTEEKEEYYQYSAISEDTPVEDYPIENITSFFEVTELHTHLPQYSEDCYSLINIQDARMCKTKPARGKGYTAGGSCITSVLMSDIEAKHIIFGNDYLNIYGIDINNHKDRYFTIGEKKRQKFSFSNIPKQISIVSSTNDTYKEEFVSNQLVEAQINPSLSPKMRNELINVLYTYNTAFASDNESLGAIRGHEVDITLNIDRPYPPVLRRPAYPASPRAREALEKHIQELIQLGVLRKVGHNEEVEVTTPVIIAWHNDKSRMVGDFRALNTYTVPDRYPIPRIQETLTQLSKA